MKAKSLVVALACLLAASVSFAAPDAKPTTKDAAPAAAKAAPAAAPTTAPVAKATKTPAVPKTVEEGVKTVQQTVAWFKQEHWRLAIAGAITLLIGLWRKSKKLFMHKVPKKALPWIAAVVSLLAILPMHLTVEPWNWKAFAWGAFATSAEAIALWALAAQHIIGKPKDDDLKPVEDEGDED